MPAAAPVAAPAAPVPAGQSAEAKPLQSQTPFGFMTAGKLADRCTEPSAYSISYCYAYLAGIHDAMRAYEVWLGQREFCAPTEVAQKDLRDVFVAFITANPRYRAAQGASVAVVALKETYPCEPDRTRPVPGRKSGTEGGDRNSAKPR
ncbi:hypothetical protein SAMN05518801_11085 [Novosphingobium sp. CF614]|nr:hypothetical protein SAMN05518801_11085 [Novosphingobium sp. CF614]